MAIYTAHHTFLPMRDSYFAQAHLHDLMAMPILLGWIDLVVDHGAPAGRAIGRDRSAVALLASCTIVWGVLDPLVQANSVADPVDALMYVIGTAAYMTMRRLIQYRQGLRTPRIRPFLVNALRA